MSADSRKLDILEANILASRKVANRVAVSIGRVSSLFPVLAEGIECLDLEAEERIDAFLFRFSSLVGMVQDQLTRSVLEVEEEDISESSRRDRRNMMEKLGAFRAEYELGEIASLRNKLSHVYPDDPERQAEILNSVYDRAPVLLEAFNDVMEYVVERHLINAEGLDRIVVGEEEADRHPNYVIPGSNPHS